MGDRERDDRTGQNAPGGSTGEGKVEPDDRSQSGRTAQSGRGNDERPRDEQGQVTEETDKGSRSGSGSGSESDSDQPEE